MTTVLSSYHWLRTADARDEKLETSTAARKSKVKSQNEDSVTF